MFLKNAKIAFCCHKNGDTFLNKKQLCFHEAHDVNEGQYHRIRKLQNDINSLTRTQYHEFLLVGIIPFIKRPRFFTSIPPAVGGGAKTVLPILLPGKRRVTALRVLNTLLSKVVGIIIGLWHRPDYCIGETHNSYEIVKGLSLASPTTEIFFDLHGAFPEEVAYTLGRTYDIRKYLNYVNLNEKRLIALADSVFVQSSEMLSHLQLKTASTAANFIVYQCGVDSETFKLLPDLRNRVRLDLKIDSDDILFVYLGGMHRWQLVDSVFEIYSEFTKQHADSAKLLILTSESAGVVSQHARRFGVESGQLRILSVPHSEVPSYLSACDLGFLLREDTVLNRVACPTKLGEYLACGLPVITSPIAEAWSWTSSQTNCVCIVDYNKPIQAAVVIADFLRERGWILSPSVRQDCRRLSINTLSKTLDFNNLKDYFTKTRVGRNLNRIG